jgi:hypothetical protein
VAIFTGTTYALGLTWKLVLYLFKSPFIIEPQNIIFIPIVSFQRPIVISAPRTIRDVLNYRDPGHWIIGLISLGAVGFTEMLITGGIANVVDMFGFRRVWGWGEGEGRGEIRIGGFFGGPVLWVFLLVAGLRK